MDATMTVKSKHPKQGKVYLTITGPDSGIIAVIHNFTDKKIEICMDGVNEPEEDSTILIPPFDWVGLEATDTGRHHLETIEAGNFKVITQV